MGGLLIADAALGIKRSSDSAQDENAIPHPMWPRIIALIAFDTPYLGLHPYVFKNGIDKYAEHVELAKNVAAGFGLTSVYGLFGNETKREEKPREEGKPTTPTTSRWSMPSVPTLKTFASAAGAAAVIGGGAAAAYWRRNDLVGGWTWVTDHAVWLKNLWDSRGMKERLDGIAELRAGTHGVDRIVFRK
jgi:hypothetical protein